MQGNDIGAWSVSSQGVVFEGVLASPPHRRVPSFRDLLAARTKDWGALIPHWQAHDIPLKSMIDCVNRLGIQTNVYTFLDAEAVDPIERWLARKGVVATCTFYAEPSLLAQDLVYDRSVHTVYVPNSDMAKIIGIRATVVGPNTAWSR